MSKQTFAVTLPDGTVATRTSATKTYTHVVVGYEPSHWRDGKPTWMTLRWSSSLDLASKEARSAAWRRWLAQNLLREIRVLEVDPR